MDCCGVEDITNRFDGTSWRTSSGLDTVPYSCCKAATEEDYKTKSDTTCTQAESAATTNKQVRLLVR